MSYQAQQDGSALFLSPSASLTSLSRCRIPVSPHFRLHSPPPRRTTEGPRHTFILTHPRRIMAACLPLLSSFRGPSKGNPSSLRALPSPHIYSPQEGGGPEVRAPDAEAQAVPGPALHTPYLLPTGPRAAPPLCSAPLRAAATLAAAGSRFWEAIRAARGGRQELGEHDCNCRARGPPARV